MSRKRLIFLLLLGDTDDTTGRASSSIASRLAEFVPAFAEIILVCVNDHGTTDDRVGPRQADETVRDINLCYTVSPSSHVAEIASVTSAFAIFRSAVLAFVQIEVRPSTDTAVGVVTKLVDMEPMESLTKAGQLPSQLHTVTLLLEENSPTNTGPSLEHADSLCHFIRCSLDVLESLKV